MRILLHCRRVFGGDYYASPVTTYSNNWTAHSGVGNIPVVDGNLSYTGLAVSTGNKIAVPGINAPDLARCQKISTGYLCTINSNLLFSIDQCSGSDSVINHSDFFMHLAHLRHKYRNNFAANLA